MKELVTESKKLMEIVTKAQKRNKYIISEKDLETLEYEFFEKGLFTTCILTHKNLGEIRGIGNTIKDVRDKYNFQIAMNVSFSKAIKDYFRYSEL